MAAINVTRQAQTSRNEACCNVMASPDENSLSALNKNNLKKRKKVQSINLPEYLFGSDGAARPSGPVSSERR